MPTEIVRARLQRHAAAGSMGVVTDTIYRECFWPALDRPTALFAPGSSGIQVQGPPSPRNVVFPPDTVFLPAARSGVPTRGDVVFLVEPRTARLQQLADDPRATRVHARGEAIVIECGMDDARAIAAGTRTRDAVRDAELAVAEAAVRIAEEAR